MDIKGLLGVPIENPPSTSRVDTSTIHPTMATTATSPIGAQGFSRVWQVGAVLQLLVTQVEGKNVSLALQQLGADLPLIQTTTNLPLAPGQQIVARVTGDLQNPSLQLVQLNQSPQDILSQTLRLQLPQQQPLSPLLANVNWVAKQPTSQQPGVNPPLSPQVLEIAKRLVDNLPTSQQLRDPNQLFKAMHLSGQFLEHSLMNRLTGQPHFNPEQDVRSQLLRLAQTLRQLVNLTPGTSKPAAPPSTTTAPQAVATADLAAPQLHEAAQQGNNEAVKTSTTNTSTAVPSAESRQAAQPQAATHASLSTMTDTKLMPDELLKQVDGVLARMQSQQLQSLQAEQQGRHMWIMELPVKHDSGIDLFDLRLQRDGHSGHQPDHEQGWSMTLAFDLDGLGPIRVKVSLVGDAITANFWTELPDTRRLFHEHIEHLRNRLNHSGLEVRELSCQCGIPPEPAVFRKSRLLDERV